MAKQVQNSNSFFNSGDSAGNHAPKLGNHATSNLTPYSSPSLANNIIQDQRDGNSQFSSHQGSNKGSGKDESKATDSDGEHTVIIHRDEEGSSLKAHPLHPVSQAGITIPEDYPKEAKLLLIVQYLHKKKKLSSEEKGKLKELVITDNTMTTAALLTWEMDQDSDELADTLKRIYIAHKLH